MEIAFVSYSVDVIIPVRYRDEYDICERLKFKKDSTIPDNFNFIVIDYGSDRHYAQRIEKQCNTLGFKYIFSGSPQKLWNASAARNIGITTSNADYVIFEDVDLKHPVDFYEKINLEIEILLESNDWLFFVIPVTYLTEEGSKLARNGLDYKTTSFLTSETCKSSSEYIQHHAPASSFLVCKRSIAIFIGGYDESFEGWGFEDSDFWVRLLMKTNIDKPRDFFRLDTRNYSAQVNWRGWRTLFRIHADIVATKGICSYHVWHPIAEHRSEHIRARNHKIFIQNCNSYSNKNHTFIPLTKKNNPTDLFLSKNPHSWNESLFGYFDNPIYIDEKYIDATSIEDVLKKNKVRRVIFNNPYGNEKRLVIYEKLRKLGMETYVVERGALPWSIYIDRNGFCAESTSYEESSWEEIDITKDQINSTIDYINNIKLSGSALEPQADMIGGNNLKKILYGESHTTKILFIALQSPSDTTTNFFCGQIGNYNNFIKEISKLPYLIPSDWKVIYKNHPLSIEKFSHPDMLSVDEYHISDILECCNAVALINSGVGVLSCLHEKFVFNFGKAFYQCSGLNQPVSNAEELTTALKQDLVFDREKSIRFINYLVNHFYSFASWTRAERNHTSVAKLSISLNIEYQKVMIDGSNHTQNSKTNNFNLLTSPLFDRYRLDEYLNREKTKTPLLINNKQEVPNNVAKSLALQKSTVAKSLKTKKAAVTDEKEKSGLSFVRKIRKLKRDPYRFFYDALAKKLH